MRKVTLGGDRLGSGNKQKIELHGYERSTHDLGYLWRSSMSAGTLVPFMHEVGLPGDTFDINLGCDVKTHPTVGPLFGSFKVQLDIFTADVRLYQGLLHNNKLKVGLNMSAVKLPIMKLYTAALDMTQEGFDIDNCQINPSCIHSYLGIRGIGMTNAAEPIEPREFQALYLLAYWDIYKNYYANKQEELGAVIHTPSTANTTTVTSADFDGTAILEWAQGNTPVSLPGPGVITVNYTGGAPDPNMFTFVTNHGLQTMTALLGFAPTPSGGVMSGTFDWATWGNLLIYGWQWTSGGVLPVGPPKVTMFDLNNLDTMRENILEQTTTAGAYDIGTADLEPFKWVMGTNETGQNKLLFSQEGLAIKTYQSDLFNNWLRTEYIDGPGGINEITAVSTVGDSFQIDALNLANKVYKMLNRIAVSGGTYEDWVIATYDHEPYAVAEAPIYHGGLSKELVFQEVVSNTATDSNGGQPLGTLAGKGIMASKHKGGQVSIKVNQHCVIVGIVSITPRIDYSQGNKWDVHLKTMDDFHKPPLDEIGFQESLNEPRAWWSTNKTLSVDEWVQTSAGKVPAWLNYMTNVNEVKGNFAVRDNEMFMILNRRFEYDAIAGEIKDLTTYIDPVKYNYIFAETAIDAQNYWTQIAVDMTVRRKMSAKVMPNL